MGNHFIINTCHSPIIQYALSREEGGLEQKKQGSGLLPPRHQPAVAVHEDAIDLVEKRDGRRVRVLVSLVGVHILEQLVQRLNIKLMGKTGSQGYLSVAGFPEGILDAAKEVVELTPPPGATIEAVHH